MTDTGQKTAEKSSDADGIKAKIAEAQVAENSWGLVGKITEGQYKTLLDQLNDHMNQMSQGIEKLSDTIKQIAATYKENEGSISDSFNDIDKKIGEAPKPPTPHAEGA
jgi:uncharacterized protein YukE